jgi:hypothetical protein
MTVMAKAIVPIGTDRATLNDTNAPKSIVRYKCDGTGCVTDVGLIGRWTADMDAGIQTVVDHHNTQSTFDGNQVGGGEKSEYHRRAAGRIGTTHESTQLSYAMRDLSVEGITAQIRTDCRILNQSNGGRQSNFEQKSASECRKWYSDQGQAGDPLLQSRISVANSLLPQAIKMEQQQQQQKADEESKQSELAACEDPHNPRFNFVWKSDEQRDRYRQEQHEKDEEVADQMKKEVARNREKIMAERSASLMAEQAAMIRMTPSLKSYYYPDTLGNA